MSEAYHCSTAQEVWLVAKRQQAWRQKWFAKIEEPKQIEPEIIKPEIPFEVLVASAYPASYPDLSLASEYPPSINQIMKSVCAAYKCSKQDLLSHRRTKKIVLPRHICMALAKRLTHRSYPEISAQMGDRDHTTIMHAVRKMQPIIDAAETELYGAAPLDHWVKACKRYAEIIVLGPVKRRANDQA